MKKWTVDLSNSRLRNKIGVENANEVAPRGCQPDFERTCLVADAIRSMDQFDVETALPQSPSAGSGDRPRFIRRIIQHLDLQTISWIIEFADRFQQTLDDIDFVEERQLDSHHRQFRKMGERLGHLVSGSSETGKR